MISLRIDSRAGTTGRTRATGQALVLMVVVAGGCKASIEADAKMQLAQNDLAEDPEEPLATSSDGPVRSMKPTAGDEAPALLGARPDLRLVSGKQTTTCRCLALVAGAPNDPAFSWESVVPTIDPVAAVVLAFSSAGTGCADEPKDSRGASYWGYKTSEKDVVVFVESCRSGRPMTTGAILPRPGEGGHVYVRPVDSSVPYARAAEKGQDACVVNVPDP